MKDETEGASFMDLRAEVVKAVAGAGAGAVAVAVAAAAAVAMNVAEEEGREVDDGAAVAVVVA